MPHAKIEISKSVHSLREKQSERRGMKMGKALFIFLGIVNWVIYHKIFRVYYFGNAAGNIMVELVLSFFAGILEVALLINFKWPVIVIAVIALLVFLAKKGRQ